jgi:uncharacterized membrane protein
MTALVAVGTLIIRIPNPLGGYFNVGDVMVFVSALVFGPFVGGFAGGVGSAISDMIGFPPFVVPTLVIKGIEGVLAGLVTNRKSILRDTLAVIIGGTAMIFGYFLAEAYPLGWGIAGALTEVPGNILQIVIGGILGIPLSNIIRRRLPQILKA